MEMFCEWVINVIFMSILSGDLCSVPADAICEHQGVYSTADLILIFGHDK